MRPAERRTRADQALAGPARARVGDRCALDCQRACVPERAHRTFAERIEPVEIDCRLERGARLVDLHQLVDIAGHAPVGNKAGVTVRGVDDHLPGGRLDGHDRGIVALAAFGEAIGDEAADHLLSDVRLGPVERRRHFVARGMDARFAICRTGELRQFLRLAHAHEPRLDLVVDERRGFRGVARGIDREHFSLRRVRLLFGRALVSDHQGQHVLLALLGKTDDRGAALGIDRAGNTVWFLRAVEAWVVVGGRGGHPRKQRRLGEREVDRVFVEIALSGRLNADVAVGIGDLVQVPLKNLFLAVVLLQFDRERDLLELAVERPFGGANQPRIGRDAGADIDVLDQLLGDRRTAASAADPAADVILVRRAQKALDVHAGVLPKAVVLGRDSRFDEERGDRGQLHGVQELRVLVRQAPEQYPAIRPAAVIDLGEPHVVLEQLFGDRHVL